MEEQPRGTFRDEAGALTPRDDDALSSMKARYKKEADLILASLTPERIASALPSEGLKKAFGTMRSETGTFHNLATLSKKGNALEIRESRLLDSEILKKYPLVYPGAGLDLEYPIVLGARNLVLVDPEFSRADFVSSLEDKISNLSDGQFEKFNNTFKFSFDFGSGPEIVSVTIDPVIYENPKQEADSKKFGHFVPPPEIGMFLVYQGPDPTSNTEAFSHLVKGGYVLGNRPLDLLLNKYRQQHPNSIEQEYTDDIDDDEKYASFLRESLERKYHHFGLDSMPVLNSTQNSNDFTFLRKR